MVREIILVCSELVIILRVRHFFKNPIKLHTIKVTRQVTGFRKEPKTKKETDLPLPVLFCLKVMLFQADLHSQVALGSHLLH